VKKKRISSETILNSDARQIIRKIHDATSPDSLKNYQYKSYKVSNDTIQGLEKVIDFIRGNNVTNN
jgi:hypothetical protein